MDVIDLLDTSGAIFPAPAIERLLASTDLVLLAEEFFLM
jgi:hypothetical protein